MTGIITRFGLLEAFRAEEWEIVSLKGGGGEV